MDQVATCDRHVSCMRILAGMPWRLDWRFTGLSKRTREFFQEVAQQGGEVKLYCAGPKMRSRGLHVHTIIHPYTQSAGIWGALLNSVAFSNRFAQKARRLDWDVLHCFNTSSLFLPNTPYLFQTLNPTYAYALETMMKEYPDEPEFRRILDYYAAVSQLEKLEYENAEMIVARTEAVKQNIVRHYGEDPQRIFVVPDGLLLPKALKATGPRSAGEMKMVLFSGTIRIMKGFNYLVEAMEKVVYEVPGAILVAAGQIYPPDKRLILRKIASSAA
ncbi:MAG: glycosyltransferase, partial [Thermoplasmata archaeon]